MHDIIRSAQLSLNNREWTYIMETVYGRENQVREGNDANGFMLPYLALLISAELPV